MRRLALLLTALVTLLALAAGDATASWAVELPQFTVETGFTGSTAATTIETAKGTTVTCKSATVEGTATTKRSGTFHLAEKECKSSGVACTGTGDSSGVILATGEWHLADDSADVIGERLGVTFVLLSPEEFGFTCAALVKVKTKGKVLAAISPADVETTAYELQLNETKGKEEFTQYENEAGEAVTTKLEASINGGAFEEAGIHATEAKLTTAKATKLLGPFTVRIPFRVVFLKVATEMQPLETLNEGTVSVKVVTQTLEGAEPAGWKNDAACINLALGQNQNCVKKVELVMAAAKLATDKIEIEWTGGRRNFAPVLLEN